MQMKVPQPIIYVFHLIQILVSLIVTTFLELFMVQNSSRMHLAQGFGIMMSLVQFVGHCLQPVC